MEYGNYIYRGVAQGCPCLYSLINGGIEPVSPVIALNGGIHSYYGHILPALMINQLLHKTEELSGGKAKTFVICQGTKHEMNRKWWETEDQNIDETSKKAIDTVKAIVKSKCFIDIIKSLNV